jgi:hypothetical protein
MSGYAMTAPLASGGPWGIAAWLVAGTVLTVAAAAGLTALSESAQEDTEAPTIPVTGSKTDTCKRCNWSVRIHAQGSDLSGGTSKSTVGAPRLLKRQPITVAEGLALSKATQALLTKGQLKIRLGAIVKLEKYIQGLPPSGLHNQQLSFDVWPPLKKAKGARYDVDSYGPSANFVG